MIARLWLEVVNGLAPVLARRGSYLGPDKPGLVLSWKGVYGMRVAWSGPAWPKGIWGKQPSVRQLSLCPELGLRAPSKRGGKLSSLAQW